MEYMIWAGLLGFGLGFCLAGSWLAIWLIWWTQSRKPGAVASSATQVVSSAELPERLERRVRELETEWANQYDKMHRLTGRMERAKQVGSARSAAPGTSPAGTPGDGTESSAEVLPTRLRKIAILRRRHEQARHA